MTSELASYAQAHGLKGAAVHAAYKMTQNFLLALPDPGEAEVLMSLKTTLELLAR